MAGPISEGAGLDSARTAGTSGQLLVCRVFEPRAAFGTGPSAPVAAEEASLCAPLGACAVSTKRRAMFETGDRHRAG
jgi:hypothetical protein